jgi:hypothetical protein
LTKEDRMAAFTYRLELADGKPADPPSFRTSVPTWRPGDEIPLRPGRTLRVLDVRDAVGPAVLIVQDVEGEPG